jgi:hypothetical protein
LSTQESAATYVKVNRVKDGWTSNVQVAADDNSLEALAAAKQKALAIIRELHDELNPVVVEEATEEEVPF